LISCNKSSKLFVCEIEFQGPAVGGYKPQEAGKEKQQPFPFGFPYGFPAGAPYFQYALKQQQQQQQQE